MNIKFKGLITITNQFGYWVVLLRTEGEKEAGTKIFCQQLTHDCGSMGFLPDSSIFSMQLSPVVVVARNVYTLDRKPILKISCGSVSIKNERRYVRDKIFDVMSDALSDDENAFLNYLIEKHENNLSFSIEDLDRLSSIEEKLEELEKE